MEMNYAYELIKSLLTKISAEHEKAYDGFVAYKNNRKITTYPMYAGIMMGTIFLIGIVWFQRKMARRTEVGIGYFRLLPTKFLMQEHIIMEIKQKHILDEIQNL